MNPGSFFREVLESHEFRSSDIVIACFAHASEHILYMSDNAILLDIAERRKAGRFLHQNMDESAA